MTCCPQLGLWGMHKVEVPVSVGREREREREREIGGQLTRLALANFAQADCVNRQTSLLKNAALYQRAQDALNTAVYPLRLFALPCDVR
jgi:hypothetical protein